MLAPTLRPGDTVVADNLGSHKVAGVREAIEARGASLLYLPPYSPDLNPIELAFSKLKRLLRTAAARTADALWSRHRRRPRPASPPPSARATCATAAMHSQGDKGLGPRAGARPAR